MANISNASGVATITGTLEQLKAFEYLNSMVIDRFENGMKCDFDDLEAQVQILKSLPPLANDKFKYQITVYAYGQGRWSMENTTKYYFEFLANHILEEERNNEFDKETIEKHKEALNKIYQDGFQIRFIYTDSESGQGFIYQEEDIIRPKYLKLDEGFNETDYPTPMYTNLTDREVVGQEDIAYTAENLQKYDVEEHPFSLADVEKLGYSDLIDSVLEDINRENKDKSQTWFSTTIKELIDDLNVDLTDQEIAKYLKDNKDLAIKYFKEFKDNLAYIILFNYDIDTELKEPLVKFLKDVALDINKKESK